MGLATPFWQDILILLGPIVLGLAGMLLAYRIGRPVWPEKFAIKIERFDGPDRRYPGQLGEASVLLILAATAMFVDRMTPDVGIVGLAVEYPLAFIAVAVGLAVLTAAYGQAKAATSGADTDYRARLSRGYWPYTLYSTVNYGFLGLCGALLAFQFLADLERVAEQRTLIQVLVTQLESPAIRDPASLHALIERLNGEIQIGLSYVMDEVNTVLLVLIAALGISFLLNFTPVGHIYEKTALNTANLSALGVAVLVLIAGSAIYFTSYVTLIDTVREPLESVRGHLDSFDPNGAMRFYEILSNLNAKRGFLGFLIALTSERGGLLVLLGALQFAFATRRQMAEMQLRRPSRPSET